MHRSVLLSALLLGWMGTACSNDLEGADRRPGNAEDPDRDGDDHPASSDCDDDDPDVYPGAPEICDGKDNDCDGVIPEDEFDQDGDGVRECDETCPPVPTDGTVPTDAGCEYIPEPSGRRITPRIEWSMGQAMTDPTTGTRLPAWRYTVEPDATNVMQAPAVGQLTDDDGDGRVTESDIPDIAVVMGDGEDDMAGVLRILSGDGTAVHASIHAASHTNPRGTLEYAPYHHAGVAIGNIDGDDAIEIATMVTTTSEVRCWPAVYEVRDSGGAVTVELEHVYEGGSYYCAAHGPALADIDDDGQIEVILGFNVLSGDGLTLEWSRSTTSSSNGRGWWSAFREGAVGYWNSGYHSFPYDMDADGRFMEVVAGKHVYTHDGDIWCELGRYEGGTWVTARDGYPAVADLLGTDGRPEIVLTGNEDVAVFDGTPVGGRCEEIARLPNDPTLDPTVPAGLPAHPNCDPTRRSFGGQPTVADFDGDGDKEIAVAGACWYSVFHFDESDGDRFARYALAQTKDWSSASTGSTVFDFNGDDRAEVVFSDEEALYVWGVNRAAGLAPWERLDPYLIDDQNHKSWTIHEYPLVADVDGDGKAEILVSNSFLPESPGAYGLYALGAADDDWVSARQVWNQHAYHVTNVGDDGSLGYAAPNFGRLATSPLNNFRNQAPGRFGALKAPNLYVTAEPPCQEGCGDIEVRVQVANEGAFITVDPATEVSLYGVSGGSRTWIDSQELGLSLGPGELSPGIVFDVSGWDAYDHLIAVVDDPERSASGWGTAKECDETDNEVRIELTDICP
jgi:hypothetical protein